jgi:hypothetical protein
LGGVGKGGAANDMKDLFDVNGEKFWKHWASAGGNAEEYVKDNLPNYALVGALLVTITYPMMVEPPEALVALDGGESTSLAAYVVLCGITTMLNFVLVVLSMVLYTQFCCCVNEETKLEFTAHFGYMIPMLAIIVVIEILLLAGLTGIVMSVTYSVAACVWTCVSCLAVTIPLVGAVIWVPMWNQKYNYVSHIKAHVEGGGAD